MLAIELEVQDDQTCQDGESQQCLSGTNSTMASLSNEPPVFLGILDRRKVYGCCCYDGKGSGDLSSRELPCV